MRKIFTFMLLAAALLVSVPSSAYVPGDPKDFEELGMPIVPTDLSGAHFGTICVPQRIVATKGIEIWDVKCVDVDPLDTTKVARLVVVAHSKCEPYTQNTLELTPGDSPWCPYDDPNPGSCEGKSYIDWLWHYGEPSDWDYELHDFRMKAGAAYFYNVCDGIGTTADSLKQRMIWVDKTDSAAAPVCQNGFYGTFEKTTINSPVTVLTQDVNTKEQRLEQVTRATIPANRGYFKGNFECVPWRWNTSSPNFTPEFQAQWGVTTSINPRHNPCTGEIYHNDPPIANAPGRMVAFNVGSRDAATGLYPIDLEHPIYLGKETNKRIENGQLIIEAADGTKYNAFGQRVK